jgi:CubicO group peptidase (beta-lactamase class C family)
MNNAFFVLAMASCISCGTPPTSRAPETAPSPPALQIDAPSAPQTVTVSPSPQRELDAKIDAIFSAQAKPGVPGCAVGVYRAGEILFARGYGLANLEYGLPLTKDSVFDVASISKQFTAMATLLLEREGKISLEDDIRKYVPEMPDYGHTIRLHHLLHHTSGVREYVSLLSLAGRENDLVTDEDLLFLLHQQKALNFVPGTEWEYSNTGYFLLSIVVKRAAGMKFSAFVKERIFDPLGMKNTTILDDHRAIVRGRATGYAVAKDGLTLHTVISRWEHPGASRVATTVGDLARWDANFYDPLVGDRTTIERMRTPGTLDSGKPLTYALGLVEETVRGRHVESHTGSTGGYVSDLIRFPAEQLTVACLCNVEGDDKTNPVTFAPEVADLFLPPAPPAEASASMGAAAKEATPATTPPKYEPSAAELAEIVGAYYDPLTFLLRVIAVEHGQVVVRGQIEASGRSAVYEPEGPRAFVSKQGLRVTFEPASKSAPARIIRKFKDEPATTLIRFEPATPKATELAEYVGRYVSDEIPRDLELVLVDGKLRTATWGHSPDDGALTGLTRDLFTFEHGGLRFERDARGRIRGFAMSGSGFRGIRFVRHRGL